MVSDALIVVDMQNDFLPGGALAVKDGDAIIGKLNELIAKSVRDGSLVVFTRDWHPKDHVSFRENGGLWPAHCVQNTKGAELNPNLAVPDGAVVINKGTDPSKEAYSGFEGTPLLAVLRKNRVEKVVVCGLATDYCVKGTAESALKLGFETLVVLDAIKGVNVNPGDSERALEYLASLGSRKVMSKEILEPQAKRTKLRA